MKKRGIVLLLFLGILVFGFAFYFDRQIVQFFSSIRDIYLGNFFLAVKFLDTEVFVILLFTLLLLWTKKKRKWILPLWLTFGITGVISVVLKVIVRRARPFAAGIVSLASGIAANPSYLTWDLSFPSFDTAFAFCAVPILSKLYPKWKYVWIGFAVLVALSRVYFGVHYLSDVIAGGIIGYLIGLAVMKLEEKTKFFERIYEKVFRRK
ncbi:MAG TPA: phosphatase PAP2 family protein [Candidatus Omnitrophota bacterium]|nr:phosphatase PAP2 family protein [Candidatus Omnitrophota bacterium]